MADSKNIMELSDANFEEEVLKEPNPFWWISGLYGAPRAA